MYEKLGKRGGPNVAMKVIVAFWIPIAVFISGLAGSQWLLQGRLDGKILTVASFIIALCLTLLVVFVIRAIQGPVKNNTVKKGKFHGGNSR